MTHAEHLDGASLLELVLTGAPLPAAVARCAVCRAEIDELQRFVVRSRRALDESALVSAGDAARVAERVLLRTTREDLRWKGDLGLVSSFVRSRLSDSRALRVLAASLLLHLLALPVLAWYGLGRTAPTPRIGFAPPADEPAWSDDEPAALPPLAPVAPPDEASLGAVERTSGAEARSSESPDSRPALERADRVRDSLAVARYLLSLGGPTLPPERADEAPLERFLRARALVGRSYRNHTDPSALRAQAGDPPDALARVLAVELLLDLHVLQDPAPPAPELLERLAALSADGADATAALEAAALARAEAYGLPIDAQALGRARAALALPADQLVLLERADAGARRVGPLRSALGGAARARADAVRARLAGGRRLARARGLSAHGFQREPPSSRGTRDPERPPLAAGVRVLYSLALMVPPNALPGLLAAVVVLTVAPGIGEPTAVAPAAPRVAQDPPPPEPEPPAEEEVPAPGDAAQEPGDAAQEPPVEPVESGEAEPATPDADPDGLTVQEPEPGPSSERPPPLELVRGYDEPMHSGKVFEITLDAAWAIALERNLTVQQAELAALSARHLADSSWGAFDALFSSRVGYVDSTFQSRDLFSTDAEEVESDTQSLSLDLVKPLVTGGNLAAAWSTDNTRTSNTLNRFDTATADVLTLSLTQPLLRGAGQSYTTTSQRQAELEYQRQVELERATRQLLLLDVSQAYWDLVSAREQLFVARSNVELGLQQARQWRLRLDAGVGTEFDVLQAETQVATREERRIFFEFQVRQAMDRLKQLLFPGTERDLWETTLVPSTPLPQQVSGDAAPPWYQCVQIALENRSELRQQRLTIDQAEVRHQGAVTERLAALDLSLSASSEGFDNEPVDAFSESLSYDFPTYQASLIYSVPIGNHAARSAEKAAWVDVRAARLAYDQRESDIVGEVRQAARQVVYQSDAVDAAVKSLVLARRQLEVERARYEQELTTTFQLLDFQQQLFDAESAERRARVDYARALVALDSALGILGEGTR